MLQPLTAGSVDLSRSIVQTPSQGGTKSFEIGDVYFDGIGWKVVAAKADFVFATQDCTELVRAVGRVQLNGTFWSVAAYELKYGIKAEEFTGWWK